MAITLNPYLSFKDQAREAMEFYKSIFGGELTLNTFKDYQASQDPSEDDKIMHSLLQADNLVLMAADTPHRLEFQPGNNFGLSLSGDDEDRLRQYFNKLSEGGQVIMPLEAAAWGDVFGMCQDKFNIRWLVNVSKAKEADS